MPAALGSVALLLVVALPLAAAGATYRLAPRRPDLALRLSIGAALALALAATVTGIDASLPLLAGRMLVMSPIAQLGAQLLALVSLGVVLALEDEPGAEVARWLPVVWLSVTGLAVALLISSLPLAVLLFLAATLVWAFGLSGRERSAAPEAVMRYAALVALVLPLLLTAYALAEHRTTTTPEIERAVLALAVPAFGLLLGVMPLHAWALTLASGTPRPMLFGALGLVQTTGFALLLRTLALPAHQWMLEAARGPLVLGGALSALLGGWLALSSRLDDPDDFLVYAVVTNAGFLLAGLGTHANAAGTGVALLLFARVTALVILMLAPRLTPLLRRTAYAVGILTLAGSPGLAGFPGLWLVLQRLPETTGSLAQAVLLSGSGLLFATAVRRWRSEPADEPAVRPTQGARQAALVLMGLLVLLGVAPQVLAPGLSDTLRGMFFRFP